MPVPKRQTSEEARNKKRITRVLPVDCRVIEWADLPVAKHSLKIGEIFGGRTINISRTGLLINSDYELDKGTKVDLALSVNEGGKPRLRFTVTVAWAKRNAYNIYGRWAMGMHIISAKPADLEALAEFFKAED
jgi:hypothetical protein